MIFRLRKQPELHVASLIPEEPEEEEMTDTGWQRWFAWYPVHVGGDLVGNHWHAPQWVWWHWVEWTEISTLGFRFYRLPEDDRV